MLLRDTTNHTPLDASLAKQYTKLMTNETYYTHSRGMPSEVKNLRTVGLGWPLMYQQ